MASTGSRRSTAPSAPSRAMLRVRNTWSTIEASDAGFISSSSSRMTSKRERSGEGNPSWSLSDRRGSIRRLPFGLQVPNTLTLVCSVVIIPALATEHVCCSMTSWRAALSAALRPSISSMQHTPPLARTSAPASSVHCPFSLTAAAVRPAADVDEPLVMMVLGSTLATNLCICDLPVPGSPTNSRCIWDRVPESICLALLTTTFRFLSCVTGSYDVVSTCVPPPECAAPLDLASYTLSVSSSGARPWTLPSVPPRSISSTDSLIPNIPDSMGHRELTMASRADISS
mmetsp:Transcript_4816/g.13902  ORF Transcript_4816/g.13902 Transcript_4816/m.13902 type:complete len:286 (+) Transcript_4816:439-1296(+)